MIANIHTKMYRCCYLVFPPDNWCATVPGLFYQKRQDTFPIRRTCPIDKSRVFSVLLLREYPISEVLQTIAKEEDFWVELSSCFLFVESLFRVSWTDFYSVVQTAWEDLAEIMEIPRLLNVGLRYSCISAESTESQSLTTFMRFPLLLPDSTRTIMGWEWEFNSGKDICRAQLLYTEQVKETLLTVDYYLNTSHTIDASGVMRWLNKANNKIEEVLGLLLSTPSV